MACDCLLRCHASSGKVLRRVTHIVRIFWTTPRIATIENTYDGGIPEPRCVLGVEEATPSLGERPIFPSAVCDIGSRYALKKALGLPRAKLIGQALVYLWVNILFPKSVDRHER